MRIVQIFLFVLIFQITCKSWESQSEMRAFWVVRYALKDSVEVEKIVQTAYESKITDIFVQVRAKGETYYNSQLETRVPVSNDKFDPLAKIIERSRLYGIRVHAWVNMFFVWYGENAPVDSSHCYNRFYDHLLKIEKLPEYSELRAAGIEGFYLNPSNKEVQNYLLNLLLEIADKYDIAGIHLDYFRYPGVTYSFTGESRTDFMLGNYFDPLKVYHDTNQYVQDRGYEVFVQADKQYRQFLNQSLNLYLAEINQGLKKSKPDILLSVAVKPDPVIARHRYFQDWRTWLKNDYCDFVLLMNYRTNDDEFKAIINQVMELKNKIVVGISTYNQNENAVNKRISLVQNSGFAGYSLFSYNHLAKNPVYRKNLNLYN